LLDSAGVLIPLIAADAKYRIASQVSQCAKQGEGAGTPGQVIKQDVWKHGQTEDLESTCGEAAGYD